jgi:hypothetical protein
MQDRRDANHQSGKRQKTALERRTDALLRMLEGEINQLEEVWMQGNQTAFTVLYLYQTESKRLMKRLSGNPKTLRRRLTALKRDLSRKAGYEANTRDTPYDDSRSIPRAKWEQIQQGAALRYDALKKLVDGLERIIRPG